MYIYGQSIPRMDAYTKVSGRALYPGDINLPNQIYLKILFSNKPHAIIKRVDTHLADQMDGVIATFTARDVPNNEYGLIINDQPVLCGPGSTKKYADRVRFVGDQVALLIAETEEIAARALNFVSVDYSELPVVVEPLVAMNSNDILLHPDRGSNVFCQYRIRSGDVSHAFKQSDIIVSGEYHTPCQEHAFLQPEAGIGYVDEEGRITVCVAGQWVHADQEQIAHALNLPIDQIRVIYPVIGGAFGGREDMSVQIVLALAIYRLRQRGITRPVKIIWSREESIIGHHKRHPFTIRSKWGATKQGKIIAAQVELIADGGAYACTSTKVLGNATVLATGVYEIPNVKVDSFSVYTNNIPSGAFRGFGGPQAIFAAECQISKLAEKLCIDPVEIRVRNLLKEGSYLSVGTPLPVGVSIQDVVGKCALRAKWKNTSNGWSVPKVPSSSNPSYLKRGVGFACGFKNVGFSFGAKERCWAKVILKGKTKIDEVVVFNAGAEVGQGSHTVFVQAAAEVLNVPVNIIRLVSSDTAVTQNSGSVSASRMTFMGGNAVKMAAEQALSKWMEEERPAIGIVEYHAPSTTPLDPETGKSEPNFAYGYVAEAVEVEVDTESGMIEIKKVICADDVGKAVNPMMVEGQIEGAIVQAQGYVLQENFIQRDGYVLTPSFSTYLIPTIFDIPEEVTSILVEKADPIGPWGSRGMGEMPFLPFAAAVIDAVHSATGVWFDEFPLTPERVLKGLGKIG
jgi:CO/xanthine dehydrogenase Mo-binding subunit